ncbi:MAG: DivIVA domain-containing protein [Actinomycetota bacterium]|nr:DivIVA domain-containing protein [Actinomycetota bacterium]
MKLTPLDIHHKEFRHSLRGYDVVEVDRFLDDVADEFERLFKENIDLSERLDASSDKIRSYQQMEQTVHNTMLAAQRSAEDIVAKARDEAATLLRDAEVKAKEIIHNALTQKQKVAAELVRIKQAEEEFRAGFKGMLERHVRGLSEISLPDDVNVLMGETDDGVMGAVEVATQEAVEAARTAPSEVAPIAAPAAAPAAELFVEPAVPTSEPEIEYITPESLAEEPPASGFVESVTLGEVEAPDLMAEEPEFDEPQEFSMPSFDSMGEREDDIDIEEID